MLSSIPKRFVQLLFGVLYVILMHRCTGTIKPNDKDVIKLTKQRFAKTASAKKVHWEKRDSDSIIVFWNVPPMDSGMVQNYTLFYHTSQDTAWSNLKGNIPPSPNPEVVIYRNEIPSTDSIFFFSIQYVSVEGMSSDLHHSTDSTATPPGGWLLLWTPK